MTKVEQKINIEVEGHKFAISRESAKELHKQLGELFGRSLSEETAERLLRNPPPYYPPPTYVPQPVYSPPKTGDWIHNPYEVTCGPDHSLSYSDICSILISESTCLAESESRCE